MKRPRVVARRVTKMDLATRSRRNCAKLMQSTCYKPKKDNLHSMGQPHGALDGQQNFQRHDRIPGQLYPTTKRIPDSPLRLPENFHDFRRSTIAGNLTCRRSDPLCSSGHSIGILSKDLIRTRRSIWATSSRKENAGTSHHPKSGNSRINLS